MKENINALDELHKGSCMGEDAINFILDKIDDKNLKKEVETELNEYQDMKVKIEDIYPKYNEGEPHKTSAMNKAMTWSGIEMKTLGDNSNSKIVELLLTGVNMGIIEGRRIINNKNLDEEVSDLAHEYVTLQEKNYDNLKQYL